MFDPKPKRCSSELPYFLSNWEQDVCDVALESCSADEDPLGVRVHFFTQDSKAHLKPSYSVGGSMLEKRLHCLRKAGYDAPMTSRALDIINSSKYTDYRRPV